MTNGVHDSSPESLLRAIEANTLDAFVRWGQALGSSFVEDGEVQLFISGTPLQLWNGVVRARFVDGADVDRKIDETLAHFAARQVPLAWLVGPGTRPLDLGRRLEAHGMTPDAEVPGMAMLLADMPAEAAAVPGLTIAEVGDGAAMVRWIETVATGSEFPDVVREQLMVLYGRYGFQPSTTVRYLLGSLEGRPVATSLLFFSAGVAGLYCVATVPDARGRGIGNAITLAALQAARDQGYAVGVLQSSAMGLAIYRRLGFREYCTFGTYFG